MEEKELRQKAKDAGVKNWHNKTIENLENELKPVRRRKGGTPLGVHQAKMSVSEGTIPPGFVGRWINDEGGRLNQAVQSDWAFVTSDENTHVGGLSESANTDIGSKISMTVGKNKDGEPMKAYLMMIREEWFEEDQLKKQGKVDKMDDAIGRGGYGADIKGLDKGHTYGKMSYNTDYKA